MVRGTCAVYKNSSLPFVKINNENEAPVCQDFEEVVVEHVLEGSVILKTKYAHRICIGGE